MLSAPSLEGVMAGLNANLPAGPAGRSAEDIRQAGQKLESLFISEMLKGLKKTLPGGGFLPSTTGSEMYEAILDTALADGLSNKGLGFSDAFERMYGSRQTGEPDTQRTQVQKAYQPNTGNNDTVGVSILA